MTVKEAKKYIEKIITLCDKIESFDIAHDELDDETGFLCDIIGYLCDYKSVLEKAIDKAEVRFD